MPVPFALFLPGQRVIRLVQRVVLLDVRIILLDRCYSACEARLRANGPAPRAGPQPPRFAESTAAMVDAS